MNYINTFFENIIRLFYPRLCPACGADLESSHQQICIRCMQALPLTWFHLHNDNPVEKIFWGRLNLLNAFSFLYFSKNSITQNILHQIKYRSNRELGIYFGKRMGEAMAVSGRFEKIDAIIPLPLFYKREKIRGYNQSALIGEGIFRATGIPVLNSVIKREKSTATQTRRSRYGRWTNVEGGFKLTDENILQGKHVLLVDDVLTTGATLEACGSELLKSPGLRLSLATLAYTLP